MTNAYTVKIEASADGQIWQAVAPAETVHVPDHDTAGTVAHDLAVDTAAGQTAADGNLWRVRVWHGADADTGSLHEAEYVYDIRDRAARVTTAEAARIERDQAAARDAYWTDGCGADVLAQDDRLREADATPDMSGPMSAAEWNARYPVGTPVRYCRGAREGDGVESRTRTPAWLLGHGAAVVSVDGTSGGIALTHVEPLTDGRTSNYQAGDEWGEAYADDEL